jgi:DNA-directed RNA polymerase subunit beta'
VRFGRDYKNKRRIAIEPSEKGVEPREYLIPKGKHIHLQDGDTVEKGDYIVEGNPAPHDILAIKGVEELAAYLVNEIQDVYRLQGVAINDKHIEVIVRQMLQKVEVDESGETELIQGEQIDRIELDEVNDRAKEEGRKPAKAHPVLLGITKASLQTRSFISAASFQETTRVLTEAAVNGKVDTLDGLKENVIVGRLIPAGTGAMMSQVREVAVKRDALILEEREKQAAEKAEAAQLPAAEEPGVSGSARARPGGPKTRRGDFRRTRSGVARLRRGLHGSRRELGKLHSFRALTPRHAADTYRARLRQAVSFLVGTAARTPRPKKLRRCF